MRYGGLSPLGRYNNDILNENSDEESNKTVRVEHTAENDKETEKNWLL